MSFDRKETPNKNKYFFFTITALLIGVLFYNLISLQIVRGREFYFNSKNSFSIKSVIRAKRGLIYDRNGVKLVDNITKYNVSLVKEEFTNSKENFDKTIQNLSKLFKTDARKLYTEGLEKVKDYKNIPEVKIFSKIEYHPYIFQIEANPSEYPIIKIDQINVRKYLYPELISHIVGYTGEINAEDYQTGKYSFGDEIGVFGVEKGYDDILRGQNGLERVDYYASENKRVASTLQQKINGNDLYLTIDIHYQKSLYDIIKRQLKDVAALNQTRSVGAVLEDVKTGNVLAMASYPNFDSNLFANGIKQEDYTKYLNDPGKPLSNKATQYAQSPGSIFKTLTDMVALQNKAIDPNTLFEANGTFDYGGVTFQDSGRTSYGNIDLKKALCVSSNIFHMKAALKLDEMYNYQGAYLMKNTFSEMDLDKVSNLNIGTEATGYFPIPEDKEKSGETWYQGDLMNASIGQGEVRLTPLGAANLINTIANKGEYKKPQIILNRENPNYFESKKLPIEPKHFDAINEGLKCAAQMVNGIVHYDQTIYPQVSEKTGTAETGQFVEGEELIHGWEITFTPSDKPEFAMSVFLENGKQGFNGGFISKEFYKLWSENKLNSPLEEESKK